MNRPPDQAWIETFKGHAATSVLHAANAVFRGTEAMLELAKPKSLAELSTALDCFIECANLALRNWEARREARKRPAAWCEPDFRTLEGPGGTSVSQG